MECRTDGESKVISWQFTSAASRHIKSPKTLVSIVGSNVQMGDNISSSFGVNLNENGSGSIYFNSTTIQDAGIYICEVERQQNITKFSAQLIVFESEPLCETNLIEDSNLSINDSIWMRCNVAFRGNWIPTVEWRQHMIRRGTNEDEGTPVTYGNHSIFLNDSNIQSTFTLLAESSIDGSVYSFIVFFIWPNGSIRTNATNIPKFNLTWNSSSVVSSLTDTISSPADKTEHPSLDPPGGSGVSLNVGLTLSAAVLAIAAAIFIYFRGFNRTSGYEIERMSTTAMSENQLDLGTQETSVDDANAVIATADSQCSSPYQMLQPQRLSQLHDYTLIILNYCNSLSRKLETTESAVEEKDKIEDLKFCGRDSKVVLYCEYEDVGLQ